MRGKCTKLVVTVGFCAFLALTTFSNSYLNRSQMSNVVACRGNISHYFINYVRNFSICHCFNVGSSYSFILNFKSLFHSIKKSGFVFYRGPPRTC